jgi:hypothetical protein
MFVGRLGWRWWLLVHGLLRPFRTELCLNELHVLAVLS